jgi:hypothetical protein
MTGLKAIAISLLIRSLVKIMADYTGFLQLRHPGELGGAYFTFSSISSAVVAVVAVKLFVAGDNDRFDWVSSLVWYVLTGWIFSFVCIVCTMNSGYWKTFVSFTTARENTRAYVQLTTYSPTKPYPTTNYFARAVTS